MKTPLLWSCLALFAMLLAWVLWSGREDLGSEQDRTPTESPATESPAQTSRPRPPDDRTPPVQRDGGDTDVQGVRQQREQPVQRWMQIHVLRKVDRTPVAGALVAARDTQRVRELRESAGADLGVEAHATILEAATTEVATDARGTAVIPRRGEQYVLEAVHGDLWGLRFVSAESKEPFVILVEKDHDLRVRVRSETTGRPVPGALVGLRRFRLYGGTLEAAHERTRSPDGIATFRHVQQILGREGPWQVFLGMPLQKPGFAPVSMAELPIEPLELVLPDTGKVIVRVFDESQVAVDGRHLRCELSAYSTESRIKPMAIGSYWSSRPIDGQGMATLSPIGIGLFLRIKVSAKDTGSRHKPVTVDLLGPKQPGETIPCEVRWGSAKDLQAHYPLVLGRLVHHDKSPWPKARIIVQPRIFPTPRSSRPARNLELSPEGGFRLVVQEPCPDGGQRIYCLRTDAGSQFGALEARLDLSRKLPPGETDIGDVLLDRGELLVAGRVMDVQGLPLPQARLHVTQLVVTGEKEYWPVVDCVGSRAIAKDGSFALHAIPGTGLPTGRLRLEVRCPGLVSAEPIEFPMGTRKLRVVLDHGGALEGSIRLAPGQSAESLAVVIQVGKRSDTLTVRKDGSFRREGLPAGRVGLVAFDLGGSPGQGRVEVEDLLIQPGATNRDPRIQNIVLFDDRSGAQAQVEVLGAGGEPVSRPLVRRLDGKGGGTTYGDHKGRCTLQAEKFPLEVLVSGFGYGEKRVLLKAGQNRVTLGPAVTITLITSAKSIGKDPAYQLGFMIYHVPSGPESFFRHVYDHTFPYNRRYFDAQGRASVPLPGPGTYEVHPYVFILGKDNLGRGGEVPLGSFPRIEVVAGKASQRFDIPIPAGVLADAVQRYSK